MKNLASLACAAVLAAWLGYPAAAAQGVQVLPGNQISSAAEGYVSKTMGVPDGDVRSVYQVPDRTLPSGRVSLAPHWPNGAPPVVNQSGRVIVPVTIAINQKRVNDVAVMVEIARPHVAGSVDVVPGAFTPAARRNWVVRRGDAVVVSLTSRGGGLHLEIPGTAQGDGCAGDSVLVQLDHPWRTIPTRVVSPREVTVDAEP